MQWAKNKQGFTIVELLIVIVVIAILAAITIVAYNGIQNRAKQSAAQTAVAQANKKVMAYAVQNSDTYPTSLAAAGITDTTGLQYTYDNDASPRTYGITASNGNFSYYVSSTMSTPTSGGYPGHAQNGMPLIANISANPSFENNVTGWSQTGSIAINSSTSRKYTGNSSMLVAARTTTTDDFTSANFTVDVNTPYTISAWVYLVADGATASNRHLWLYNQSGGATALDISYPAIGAWRRISDTFTPTNPLLTIRIHSVTGGALYIDSLMITKGSTLYQYADGDSANWIWSGTVGNSTSSGPGLAS